VVILTSSMPTSRDYCGAFRTPTFLKVVARRIVDRRVLHLIKMWLDCPVEEADERGRKTRTDGGATTIARHSARVAALTAAGEPYMRRFVLGWKKLGHLSEVSALALSPMPMTS